MRTATSANLTPVSGTSWNLLLLLPKSMGPPMPPPMPPMGPPPPFCHTREGACQQVGAQCVRPDASAPARGLGVWCAALWQSLRARVWLEGAREGGRARAWGLGRCASGARWRVVRTRLSPPEQEEQAAKGKQREEQVAQEGHVVALLVALRHGDVHPVLGQDVHQVRVVGQHHSRTAAERALRVSARGATGGRGGPEPRDRGSVHGTHPSTAVSCSAEPSLEKRTRSTLPLVTALMNSL